MKCISCNSDIQGNTCEVCGAAISNESILLHKNKDTTVPGALIRVMLALALGFVGGFAFSFLTFIEVALMRRAYILGQVNDYWKWNDLSKKTLIIGAIAAGITLLFGSISLFSSGLGALISLMY